MTDKAFKRVLKRHKKQYSRWDRFNRNASYGFGWSHHHRRKVHLVYHRFTKPLKTFAVSGQESSLHENHRVCSEHPHHRWIECPHGRWCWRFCMGCYGNTCPHCGRQVKVKRRFKSQR